MRQIINDLQRDQWHDFLDTVTTEHSGDDVTIEVVSEEFGDGVEAARLPLSYVEYDEKDDALIVGVGGTTGRFPVVLHRIINHPRSIVAEEPSADIALVLQIVAGDGIETIVTIRAR